MGLAKIGIEGTLEITEAGTHRFTVERHRSAFASTAPVPLRVTTRLGASIINRAAEDFARMTATR